MDITNTIAIYGKSGHGLVVQQIAEACGYTRIIWIDDAARDGAFTFDAFLEKHADIPVALGIGSNYARKAVYTKLKDVKCEIKTLIHPSAIIAKNVIIGEGSIIMPLSVVNAQAVIGIGAIINTHTCVEHECHIEDFVHLSPQVGLGGNTRIGELTHIGIGTSVIQCLSIGKESIIAAGSVIIDPVPNQVMVAGVPATIKKELK